MKRLVIFDLDGTLMNTIADLADACNHALRVCGYKTHRVEDYPAMVGNGIYRLMMRSLRAQGLEAEEMGSEVMAMTPHFKQYYDAHNADKSVPYAGIPELLKRLQSRGVMIAVASNKYQAATEKIVRTFFGDIKIVSILGQRENAPKKPDPMIVYETMQTAGITDKTEVLYVGDSGVDIQTAQNAGVECVAVSWGFVPREGLVAFGPDHIVDRAEEIDELIK